MANDCFNRLWIKGEKEEIERFLHAIEGVNQFGEESKFAMTKLVVYADVSIEIEMMYLIKKELGLDLDFIQTFGGWGTDRDVYGVWEPKYVRKNIVRINYSTAWTPNVDFIVEVSKQFKLKFVLKYYEGNMRIWGTCISEDGSLEQEGYNYNIRKNLY